MPQSLNQKAVNNFVKGLITEASELTFPEGASVDESNCDLRRDGTRRRRLGVAVESSNVLSSFEVTDPDFVITGEWLNVNGVIDQEFLVVQKASTLYFYNKADLPHSGQIETNSVDLIPFQHAGSVGAANAKCQFTSIKGNLVVSSAAINTIVIEYSSGTFTSTAISFKTRDFEYLGDTEDYLVEGSSGLSGAALDKRVYDSLNSGWADLNNGRTGSSLTYYRTQASNAYPALTHPWFSGKNSTELFDVDEWKKIGAGTSLSGLGRYQLDFFSKDRSTAISGSGFSVTTIDTEVETSRFRCVESFAGRVFYAGLDSAKHSGTILFSKLVETTDDLGKCHQVNDPTSEYLSTLLATDGGEIQIPDAFKIQKLYAYQNSLFIFAENGVWQITGVDGVFKADAFAVNRVTRTGILSAETFVAAEGTPFWWSKVGIHTLSTDPVSGQGQGQNLTIPTIQTLWDKIDANVKLKVKAVYDNINKRIYWAYPDKDETVESKLNNFLILDIPLQAFFTWKVSDQASSTSCVVGMAFYSGFGASELELDVLSASGANDVLTAGEGTDVNAGSFVTSTVYIIKTVGSTDFTAIGASANTVGVVFTATGAGSGSGVATTANDVISTQVSTFASGDPAIVLLIRDGSTNKLTMGSFSSKTFLDWGDTNYSSFAVTGYDFMGDLTRKKNAPYIVTYARLTEEGFTGNSSDGYEPIRPSSLKVSLAWDFKETFSTPEEAYRLKYTVVPDSDDLTKFDYPEDVITSRLKARGHGRSMRIKYESTQGKDFILLGWGLLNAVNPRF